MKIHLHLDKDNGKDTISLKIENKRKNTRINKVVTITAALVPNKSRNNLKKDGDRVQYRRIQGVCKIQHN